MDPAICLNPLSADPVFKGVGPNIVITMSAEDPGMVLGHQQAQSWLLSYTSFDLRSLDSITRNGRRDLAKFRGT